MTPADNSMKDGLTRQNLHGVWAAITTPFDENDRLDEGVLRENVRRLAAAGVHGIYTTDSDGEFYAVEIDEFKQLAKIFADETQRLGIPTMMGVTWCNTQGMIERLQVAARLGILGAHVGHPFFMPMTPASYRAFWADVQQAVPEWFGLIHYNTPRVHNYQHGADYAALSREIPNLIGSKHVGGDVPDFLALVADSPDLSHFTGEHSLTPYIFLGARGVYSWFTSFNPRYILDWYDDCVNKRWDEAIHRQRRVHAFSRAKAAAMAGQGNLHGILNKGMAAASPFLVGSPRTRRPYLPIADEDIERFRRVVEEQFPDLAWRP